MATIQSWKCSSFSKSGNLKMTKLSKTSYSLDLGGEGAAYLGGPWRVCRRKTLEKAVCGRSC